MRPQIREMQGKPADEVGLRGAGFPRLPQPVTLCDRSGYRTAVTVPDETWGDWQ